MCIDTQTPFLIRLVLLIYDVGSNNNTPQCIVMKECMQSGSKRLLFAGYTVLKNNASARLLQRSCGKPYICATFAIYLPARSIPKPAEPVFNPTYPRTMNLERSLAAVLLLLCCCLAAVGGARAQCTAGITTNSPICSGQTLHLTATPAGQNAYSWAGPNGFTAITDTASISSVNGLAAGTYTVTVTCINGTTSTATAVVQVKASPTVGASSTGVYCSGNTVTLQAIGGGPNATFVWSGPSAFTSNVQNPTLTNVTSANDGAYTVTVTAANGCTREALTNVSINTPPSVMTSVTGSPCVGGSVTLNVASPNGAAYSWAGPAGFVSPLQNPPVNNLQPSNGGTYTVTVTDINNCTNSGFLTLVVTVITATATSNSPICEGKTISLKATGGTLYNWTGPAGFIANVQNPDRPVATAAMSGVYTVTVSDANNCTVTTTTNVVVSGGPVVTLNAINITCFGAHDGIIQTNVVNGTPTFNYVWSAGPPVADNVSLGKGTYSVTVTDANGCASSASATVDEPAVILALVTPTAATCSNRNDGKGSALVSGGVQPYAYAWNSGEVTNMAQLLRVGADTLTVTDAKGCRSVVPFVVSSPPPLLIVDSTAAAVNCFGGGDGQACITVQGGTIPYTVNWTTAAQATLCATNLSPGLYPVEVTDQNGCQATSSVRIVQPADSIKLQISGAPAACNATATGTATVVATGGTPQQQGSNSVYNYKWSGSAAGQLDPSATALPADVYTVTVTDSRGCSATATVSITEPPAMHLKAHAIPALCFGADNGFVVIDTTYGGNNGIYRYSLDCTNFQLDTLFAGVASGTYTVCAQDVRGCTASAPITVGQPPELQVAIYTQGITNVNGVPTVTKDLGEIVTLSTTVNDPLAQLTYAWTPTTWLKCGADTTCHTVTVQPLEPTEYTVQVTDKAGCTSSARVLIDVQKVRNLFVPNVFTPNGDGNNDILTIFGGNGVTRIKVFKVFDRWGEKMFEAYNFQPNDPTFGWDGKFHNQAMNPAVFVYFLEAEFIDGLTIPYRGDVTLLK